MKKVMLGNCGCCCWASAALMDSKTAAAIAARRSERVIGLSLGSGYRTRAQEVSDAAANTPNSQLRGEKKAARGPHPGPLHPPHPWTSRFYSAAFNPITFELG